jgi:penicillin-binding protein 1C
MPGGRLTAAPVLFKIADLLGPPASKTDAPPPAGALLVGRHGLPRRLQRLDPGQPAQAESSASTPMIVYPPDGAHLEWRGEEVPLEAIGGRRPFRWLIDGIPLPPGCRADRFTGSPKGSASRSSPSSTPMAAAPAARLPGSDMVG